MVYNLTNLTNVTNIYQLTHETNVLTGGLFMIFFIGVLFIVLLLTVMEKKGAKEALVGVSASFLIISVIAYFLDFLPLWFALFPFAVFVIGMVFAFLDV